MVSGVVFSHILFLKLLPLTSQPFLGGGDAVHVQGKLLFRPLFAEVAALLPRPGEHIQVSGNILLRIALDRLDAIAQPFITAAEGIPAGEE